MANDLLGGAHPSVLEIQPGVAIETDDEAALLVQEPAQEAGAGKAAVGDDDDVLAGRGPRTNR